MTCARMGTLPQTNATSAASDNTPTNTAACTRSTSPSVKQSAYTTERLADKLREIGSPPRRLRPETSFGFGAWTPSLPF